MNIRLTDKSTLLIKTEKNYLVFLAGISGKSVYKLQSLPENFIEDDYRI